MTATPLMGAAAAWRQPDDNLERLGFRKTSESTASFRSTPDGKPIQFVGYTFELSRDEWNMS
jgi:hypothetical protein